MTPFKLPELNPDQECTVVSAVVATLFLIAFFAVMGTLIY